MPMPMALRTIFLKSTKIDVYVNVKSAQTDLIADLAKTIPTTGDTPYD
ncbi:hypothetical protein MIZ03_0983 [Rhodoferax lithotrophicus]|uniref:Uncharacterized protein n=1 Tax=Rhodoferax lithotrophicus TaxID=2798804 RepID=A0ABN6D3B4_9BURK|nr:hypothetical protein MIZ03_0983 [Rhodoferax sp. MIZ03]